METIKAILEHFPQGLVMGLLLNGGLIALTYFLVWKLLRTRLQRWRIQLKERVDGAQIRRELKNAVLTLCVGALYSSSVLYWSSQGYTQLYLDFWEHPFWSLSGFFILLILDDTWFYWTHRLLHHPKLYRWVHLEHHKSVDVNPFSSLSFHLVESLLLTLWILPASFILPIYAPVLGIVQLWGLLDNIKSHLGYELFPRWWNRSPLRFLTSSTYHNQHHSRFNGNYGVHFRFWDRWMGTELTDYEEEYDAIQSRK